ncbi:leucine-rich repeat-containing protein 70-like [Liolophura sinensis]|uniref:leucine-rich repeat-containing protein 70-like n=1 Tax=Liolophura sinensis TaxID=3198878 RepID=UPI0031588E7D
MSRIELAAFGELNELTTLDLSHNNISVLHAYMLDGIRGNPDVMYIHDGTFSGLNVSTLDVQFTGISELNCSDFSGIGEKVSRIYLPNNLLNRVPSCTLARFNSITKLDLRNNSIITVRPSDFEHFPRLQTLDLSANGMSRIELAAFGELNELTTLDLSHNNISVLHAYMFHGLTELKTLDLDFNKLTSLDDNLFDDLTNLENLYLRNNRISGLSKRTFRNLRRLGYISLMRNKLTHLLPETFAGLTNLYGLSLHDNRLREIGPRMFVGLSKVTFIYLSLNKLTVINRDAFVDFPVLRYLNLTGNAIRNMQAGNPLTCGCEIAGLRNGTVPDKIDLVRCHSPRAFTGYLAVCFPLSACSGSVSVSVSDKTRWLCEQDSNIKLSNLTVTVENGVVSVTWTKTGPGMMTGYRVEYHPVNDIGMGGSTLVHPETEKVLLDDLSKDTTYNICVFAVVGSRRKSPAVCTVILVISARNETPFAEGGVVIGLASALGLCVLLAGAVTICLYVRKRRSGQNQSNNSSLDTAPGYSQSVSTNPVSAPTSACVQAEPGDEIDSVYIRRPNNESQTEDGNIYEKIGTSTAYENTSFGS